jgi:hypothetical protein
MCYIILPREMCHIFASFLGRLNFCVHFWVVFWHMVFVDGFLLEYFGFPSLGFQGKKNLCNVCIYHCIFSILVLKNCF